MKTRLNTRCVTHFVHLPHPGHEGDTAAVGEVTAWYQEPGQMVQAGGLLYQVSWPGVVIEYSAEQTGILKKCYRKLRETVRPDDLLCEMSVIETDC